MTVEWKARCLLARVFHLPYDDNDSRELGQLRDDIREFLKTAPKDGLSESERKQLDLVGYPGPTIYVSDEDADIIADLIENPRKPTKALVQLMKGDYEGLPDMPYPDDEPEPEKPRPMIGMYKDCPWPSHQVDCTCGKKK